MTREELTEALDDIKPILRAYSDSDIISFRIENDRILLIPEMSGFTGHFIEALAAYLKAQFVPWIITTFPETRIEIG